MNIRTVSLVVAALMLTLPARAQMPAPGAAPAQAPVTTPPAMPGTVAPAPSPAPPAAAAPAGSVADAGSLLGGSRGDVANVDEVTLTLKPAVMAAGSAKWDNAADTLDKVFEGLSREIGKAGLKVAGRPLVRFVETTDESFRYEAMLPVDRTIPGQPNLSPEIRFAETPSGKALRFTHKAPYDDIDSTYEVLTAYLDAKGLEVQDVFVEEYVSDLKDAGMPDFELNVYVQPK